MSQQLELNGENTSKAVESYVGSAPDGRRAEIFKDVEKTLGLVPGFFKMLPPTHLDGEWRIFRDFQLGRQTALEPKIKELIGLAVASVMQCPYCTYFHTVAAGIHHASAQEVDEALLMAKQTAGWSTFLSGARYDLSQLKQEMGVIKDHLAKAQIGRAHV